MSTSAGKTAATPAAKRSSSSSTATATSAEPEVVEEQHEVVLPIVLGGWSVGDAAPPAPPPPAPPAPPPSSAAAARLDVADPEEEALDEEADRFAEHALSSPWTHARRPGHPDVSRPLRRAPSGPPTLGPTVEQLLRTPGVPLDLRTRESMQERFQRDFARVRVHTGAAADQAARSLGALAFTVGEHIVFRRDQFAPASAAGQRLLAHELVHVAQQDGRVASMPLRQKAPAAEGVKFKFSVRVHAKLSDAELLIAFVRQYRRLASDADAVRVRDAEHWAWTAKAPQVTDADVRRGFILIPVTDFTLRAGDAAEQKANRDDLGQMAGEEKASLDQEADREFWERTHYKPGQALGGSANDREMAKYWLILRDQLLRDRREIAALPPTLRQFLFTEGARRVVQPRDYAQVLRIAHKLATLQSSELDDYKAKVTAETDSWVAFEASIDDYLVEHEQRVVEQIDREQVKRRLWGLEDLYKKWKEWKSLQSTARTTPSRDEFGVYDPNKRLFTEMAEKAEAELTTGLAAHNFASIGDFEQGIHAYERAFEKQGQTVAFDLLDRYEHVLYEAEKKLADPTYASGLYQALAATQAKQHYQQASESAAAARMITPDPELHRYLPGEWQFKRGLEEKAASEHAQAESQVNAVAEKGSIIGNRDFDREALASAGDASGVAALLRDYIQARREDIQKSRRKLTDDPEVVFKLDQLIQSVYVADEIKKDSISDLIIRDKIHDVGIGDAIVKILLGVLAVAITIATAGTGTIAALGAIAVFGIGAYSAVQEYREYETKHAAYGAQLLSEDPSFAWVVVSIVGAGIDLAAAASALKAMKPAVDAFNATGDVARLEKELSTLAEVNEALRANVVKAARAEKQYQQAIKGLLSTGGRLRVVIVPFGEEFGRLVVVAYYLAKRGVLSFEKFLLELKAQKIIEDVEALTPPQIGMLQRAQLEGIEGARTGLVDYEQLSEKIRGVYSAEQVEEIAMQGRALGLEKDQIRDFLEMGAIAKPSKAKLPLTPEQLQEQMTNWVKVTRARGYPYLFESAESYAKFRAEAESLAKRFNLPDGEIVVQGSAWRTPAAKDVDVALFVSDEQFAAYAERCREGIRVRAKPGAGERIVKDLDAYVDRGFIPMFYFDRISRPTFAEAAKDVFGAMFNIELDFSVMKRSSSVALHPSSADL